jgi:hypothetical protein
MVQHIMADFSGAAIEKGKFADITKPVFRLLKDKANSSS